MSVALLGACEPDTEVNFSSDLLRFCKGTLGGILVDFMLPALHPGSRQAKCFHSGAPIFSLVGDQLGLILQGFTALRYSDDNTHKNEEYGDSYSEGPGKGKIKFEPTIVIECSMQGLCGTTFCL